MSAPTWDDRIDFSVLSCIGGPLDGATMPVAPRVRTVRAPQWGDGCYYEVQIVRGEYRLVWHAPAAMLFTTLRPEAPNA